MKYSISMQNLLVLIILLFNSNNSNQFPGAKTDAEKCRDLQPGQKGFLQLSNEKEPGELLMIYGQVIDLNTKQPIDEASIFFYQTDNDGIYSKSGRDEDARIKGILHTNEEGCFKIKTILPGDYPGQKNSRHLHYVINAKGYKEIKSALFFKGFTTQNISGQGTLTVLDIRKDAAGTWIGSTYFSLEKIGP